ncbi:MAG: Oxygen-independent coproporphyrinogen-III oxidase, partial [Bacteroidota bacterium]
QDKGFENITIDLIYGTPTLSNANWATNLNTAIHLKVPHISAYNLTVEEKTPLQKLIQQNKKENVNEATSAYQMQQLMDTLCSHDFEHYEISNFAKAGRYAIHNTNYWKGVPYLGIGPSAHSYKNNLRCWNVANTQKYMAGVDANKLEIEEEFLSKKNIFNEWIMTGLRTQWGINTEEAKLKYNHQWIYELLLEAQTHIAIGNLSNKNNVLKITTNGKLIADKIMSDLFIA